MGLPSRRVAGLFSVVAAIILIVLAPPRPATAGPTLLIDASTGEVLSADNPDAPWYPASLTKLMTAYLTFEAVKAGKIAWDGPLPLSENARRQPATRIGLKAGIKLNVEQGVRGLLLQSANDFAMALAELIGGSEEGFAAMMNDAARRLGMTRSNFANPHGLPDATQVSTARDMAILAMAIHRDFPDRAEVFSTPSFVIHRQTFHSQNDLLRTFAGAEGMKTGFTCGAGYNVVASATRDGRRLMVVVMGAVTRGARSKRAAELLQAGFDHVTGVKPFEAKPVKLAAFAMVPAEAVPVYDMSRETQTRKCGNRVRRPVRKGQVIAKAGVKTGKATPGQPSTEEGGAATNGPKGASASRPAAKAKTGAEDDE
jgi:D-alanyl-D-alanine carboxypeptidase